MSSKLLEVRHLVTQFQTDRGSFRVVDDISFDIAAGEVVGLVGESGSGKSITSLSIMGLIKPPGRVAEGSIRLDGEELKGLTAKAWRSVRGRRLSMIFQEPMTSLNPVIPVGEQIAETLRQHEGLKRKEAMARAVTMLGMVGIPMPETRARQYPHQMSGGMRQRVMIAMALACNPRLLIADEPTTALDVTIQAQILALIKALNAERGMGVLLVTHDLGVVNEMCERVMVMYAGRIVEEGAVRDVFERPRHPYTAALLRSIPVIGGPREKLYSIPGSVPQPHNMPKGCRFQSRCAYATARCVETPSLTEVAPGHLAACWHGERLAAEQADAAFGEEALR